MKTSIIADNQFVTKEGMKCILNGSNITHIVAVTNVGELQKQLAVYPDALVILDYTLFDFVSVQQLLVVKAAAQKSDWLLFSDELGEEFMRYVLFSDPTISVVMKHGSQQEIQLALHNILSGIPYICELAEQILTATVPVRKVSEMIKLTISEKTILHEIASGKTTKEIAYEKNLSFHTVNTHRKNIFRKLGVNNLHEAIKYAVRAGIFDIAEYYI